MVETPKRLNIDTKNRGQSIYCVPSSSYRALGEVLTTKESG
jgi:hypothetical protein